MRNFLDDTNSFLARLKKVQGKKKRDLAARDALKEAEEAERDGAEEESHADPSAVVIEEEVSGDLLSSKDADVIF